MLLFPLCKWAGWLTITTTVQCFHFGIFCYYLTCKSWLKAKFGKLNQCAVYLKSCFCVLQLHTNTWVGCVFLALLQFGVCTFNVSGFWFWFCPNQVKPSNHKPNVQYSQMHKGLTKKCNTCLWDGEENSRSDSSLYDYGRKAILQLSIGMFTLESNPWSWVGGMLCDWPCGLSNQIKYAICSY